MKKFILILSIIILYCQCSFAQTGGVNFQGVARNSSGTVLANQKINLKFSILKTSETGTIEYTETKEVTTNAQGVFSVVVGEVNVTSFAAIDWKVSPKFLKVEMDPAGGSSFVVMGTTRLQNVPYAYYANGVNASNIDGTVSIAKGGTGGTDAATARTNLGLVIGTNVQAPLTAGTDYLTPTGNAASASKLATAKKINGIDFDGSTDITIPTTADASTLSGTVPVSKGGTGATTAAAARTNLGLVIGTNVQAPLTAGTDYLTPTGNASSLTNFPILNQNTTGNAATASLAGNITASTNLTLTTLSNLNSVGTITSGIWSSTAISVSNGGTGTSTLSGIVLGNGTSPLSGIRGGNFGEILHWNGSTWEISGTGKLAIGNNAGATTQGINSVAIGYNAGNNNQADFSVAMGEYAGKINQGNSAVSVGPGSGENNQGYAATALGRNSGAQNQGINSVSIGNNSGKNFQGSRAIAVGLNSAFDSQGQNSVAIGNASGSNLQGENSIALGFEAGNDNQGLSAISIGTTAGSYYQGEKSIAIGESSGTTNQGSYAVAIGVGAAYDTQGVNSVAIGYMAGELNQNTNAIALGKSAAKNNQGASSVALGYEAALDNQGSFSIAIGRNAGYSRQAIESIAIGKEAGMYDQAGSNIAIGSYSGSTMQGLGSIALGENAATSNQGSFSVSIGKNAGSNFQGNNSIAIGQDAGITSQNINSIALGNTAGAVNQGISSIAIGEGAAIERQGNGAIAIGSGAGFYDQGANAIAIGKLAGNTVQTANSIVINASGVALSNNNTQGLFIKPIRSYNDNSPLLTYNNTTGEISANTNKTFVINHPTNPNKYLVHASLEGPEAGVYYRGEAKVVNNKFVKVSLPDYVSAFANNFTIQITKIFEGSKSQNFTYETSRVKDNSFTVYGKNGSFYWTVYAKRNIVEVEPNKSEFELIGDGPYKYLKKIN